MTQQFKDVVEKSPKSGTLLIALYSALLALVVFISGYQQWVYAQQRSDVNAIICQQKEIISDLAKRQDINRDKIQLLAQANADQDLRIAREYVSLERHACDLREVKESIKEGFGQLTRQVDDLRKVHK